MTVLEFVRAAGRIGAASLLLATAACDTVSDRMSARANLAHNPADFGPPDAPKPAAANESYRIGPLDTLTINVFQVPDLSGDHQVDPTGTVTLPLIGDIMAQGLTPRELADVVRQKYDARYLRSPEVQVTVKEAVSERITVEGAVKTPGIFPVTGASSLLQAIAMAHGIDETGNSHRVVVFRTVDAKRQAAAFDLSEIRKGKEPDPKLYGNDIVVVDGSAIKRGFHDVLQSIPLLAIFGAF